MDFSGIVFVQRVYKYNRARCFRAQEPAAHDTAREEEARKSVPSIRARGAVPRMSTNPIPTRPLFPCS